MESDVEIRPLKKEREIALFIVSGIPNLCIKSINVAGLNLYIIKRSKRFQ